MKRILIVGCGYVGSKLAERLLRDGLEVIGLRRNISLLSPEIKGVSCDVTTGDGFENIPCGIDALVYAVSAKRHDAEAYQGAYRTGPRNIADFLFRRGDSLQRVLYVSSTGVFAQNSGEWVDESSPAQPTEFTGSFVLQGEKSFRDFQDVFTSVRFGGIYGPERTFFIRQVLEQTANIDPNTISYTNRIHQEDCAGILQHLLKLKSAPPLVLGVDDEPSEKNEFLAWLADRLRVNLHVLPESPVKSVTGKRCKNDFVKSLGYTFLFPNYRLGYESLLANENS